MNVVIMLVFVSLLLVSAALIFLLYGMRQGDFDHGERLSLLPLTDERRNATTSPATTKVAGDPAGAGSGESTEMLKNQGTIDP